MILTGMKRSGGNDIGEKNSYANKPNKMTNEEIKTLYFIGNNEPTVILTYFDWEVVNYFLDVSGNIKGELDKGNTEYFDDIKTDLKHCTIHLHKLNGGVKIIPIGELESIGGYEVFANNVIMTYENRMQKVNDLLFKYNICWTNEEVEGVKLIEL